MKSSKNLKNEDDPQPSLPQGKGSIPGGILLILLAFWAGSQPDPTWGLVGFLPFFTLGVCLIFYGRFKK